jgi:uncharacterized membrane protein YhaH (DUF805 family)
MSWYMKVIKKYAVFNGRARRKEYWMFVLFNLIFLILAVALDNLLGTAFQDTGYGIIYLIYTLGVFIPSLAVLVRRLHDLGKSGWWLFIILIPLVGGIWFLVLMATDGQRLDNAYGPDPKTVPAMGA